MNKRILFYTVAVAFFYSCNEKPVTTDIVQEHTAGVPAIDDVSNKNANAGDTIAILGKNFTKDTRVDFGTVEARVITVAADRLSVIVPAGARAVYITARNGFFVSNKALFGYLSKYSNPVFKPVLADPSVFRDPVSGEFFAYGTADTWPDGKSHIVAVIRSKDLVNWTYARDAFTTTPAWKTGTGVGVWAPDVNYVDGKYYMYYALSSFFDVNPGIGLAIASSPAGPFVDAGKIFLSGEVDVRNSIDPTYFEENGKKYLLWGSYNLNVGTQTQWGTFLTELTADGRAVADIKKITKIAASDFEGVMIYKKNGYYYFFGSRGGCCDGVNSTYHVRVARATRLEGPYLDRNNKDIAASMGVGTVFLKASDRFVGPGHNAQIISDKNGTEWFVYHAMERNNATVPVGSNTLNLRALMIDPIKWDAEGWPFIENDIPSAATADGPVF
ncbi:family 43 glycosylhydrolase [Niabella sp.]|uniref:family 43 glycosylhydrolase n=1 Tax=Niabella sp. TaxID=1962976 RepID=UPI00260B0C32|nr:family 43 glycosylhydrolase [Niabella sp.]